MLIKYLSRIYVVFKLIFKHFRCIPLTVIILNGYVMERKTNNSYIN